jgi:hypothetical protein
MKRKTFLDGKHTFALTGRAEGCVSQITKHHATQGEGKFVVVHSGHVAPLIHKYAIFVAELSTSRFGRSIPPKAPAFPFDWGLCGPQVRSELFDEEKNLLPL